MTGAEQGAYVERYRFTVRVAAAVLGCAAFAVAAVVVAMPLALRVATIAFFGVGGVLLAVNALAGRVALRLDAAGITLGGRVLRYQGSTRRVGWPVVGAVVLWRLHGPGYSVRYLGVIRNDGAPTPTGRPVGAAGELGLAFLQGVAAAPDARLVAGSVAIQ